jgi:hypothetical protein
VLALFLGLVLGLAWGWGIQPVQWTDAPANLLRADLQDEYLRMSIDSYRVNGDENLAIKRFTDLGEKALPLFESIKANPGKLDPNFVLIYEQLLVRKNVITPAGSAQAEAAPAASMGVSIAIILGGLLAIGGVMAAALWLFRGTRRTPGQPATPAQQAAEIARSTERTDYAAMGENQPVAHYVTTYVIGDDLFDDSFSIDSPSGEFLGECGAGISETIGVGDPKKVTAFEVWMFDKNDIQTITKVLMSPHAFNDPSFRSKLEAKGELVALEPHKQIVLETQTLQMIATVSDMKIGEGLLPEGSYFDRVTLELAIWAKK